MTTSVFDVFDIAQPRHDGEFKQQSNVDANGRISAMQHLVCDSKRPSWATFSRGEAAALLKLYQGAAVNIDVHANGVSLQLSGQPPLFKKSEPKNLIPEVEATKKPVVKSPKKPAPVTPAATLAPPPPVVDGPLKFAKTCVTYWNLMAQTYPGACKQAVSQAASDLLVKGKVKPSEIFKEWEPLNFKPLPKYGHYAGQIVFRSKFDDRAKLTEAFHSVAAACNFPEELVCLEWDDETSPRPYSAGNTVQASNHYVFTEKEHYNFKKHAKRFSKYVAAVHAFESVDEATGEPTTVMWLYLPGKKWDGTSCFNFMKEVVARYHGEVNENVTKADEMLTMTEDAKAALDNPLYILRYLLLLPLAIFLNLSATLWEKADAKHTPHRLGAKGDREMSFLNLTADQSKAMCAAFKASNMPPTAGLLYTLVTAYKRHVGVYPFGINLQASLQTRAFAPVIKERYLIGDWLIGPCYKVRKVFKGLKAALGHGEEEYWKPEDAKTLYTQLIHDVTNCTGRVREAFVAREYGVIKGGPAPYQNQDLYGDINRMNDSILFNNYGPRFMHPEAKAVSWNWTGPGKLDCNTISVNGCTSITLASTVMGIEKVTAVRDEMHKIIGEFVEAHQKKQT